MLNEPSDVWSIQIEMHRRGYIQEMYKEMALTHYDFGSHVKYSQTFVQRLCYIYDSPHFNTSNWLQTNGFFPSWTFLWCSSSPYTSFPLSISTYFVWYRIPQPSSGQINVSPPPWCFFRCLYSPDDVWNFRSQPGSVHSNSFLSLCSNRCLFSSCSATQSFPHSATRTPSDASPPFPRPASPDGSLSSPLSHCSRPSDRSEGLGFVERSDGSFRSLRSPGSPSTTDTNEWRGSE